VAQQVVDTTIHTAGPKWQLIQLATNQPRASGMSATIATSHLFQSSKLSTPRLTFSFTRRERNPRRAVNQQWSKNWYKLKTDKLHRKTFKLICRVHQHKARSPTNYPISIPKPLKVSYKLLKRTMKRVARLAMNLVTKSISLVALSLKKTKYSFRTIANSRSSQINLWSAIQSLINN
jgi:hypothetical protein